jgi:imidazole glycerol-phosphate synthase subunit HisH
MPTIAIIDYGMGNLRSVQKGFAHVGVAAEITRDVATIERARGVVLPGVGAFGACMDNLRDYGLVDAVRRVIERGTPFLGICLGLQLLFDESEEFGPVRGLGVLGGRCVRFRQRDDPDFRIPHMGWNQIQKQQTPEVLAGVDDGAFVYFVHSYYVEPRDPGLIATVTDYGGEFVSSIARDNLFACQFHPEKSQGVGLRILRNFGALVGEADARMLPIAYRQSSPPPSGAGRGGR